VSAATPLSPFPVVRPYDLQTAAASTTCWLMDQLWTMPAVGIIGGHPKSYKTWMALEMAVAVASGSACLATFAVPAAGPVLLYAAEDSQSDLRLRLESLAHHHQIPLAHLDIRVITADSLRLDRTADQQRLAATLLLHRPVLLILDPLVRLHAMDENAAGEIAALLGYLRALQRQSGSAIAVVHHAKKSLPTQGGAGYSLRGSSDLYAWVDSFLYLRRHHGQLLLSAEHRSAPNAGPFVLELVTESGPHLRLMPQTSELAMPDPLPDQILALLGQGCEPRTAESMRSNLPVRNQRLVECLRQLCEQRKVVRLPQGYVLASSTIPLMSTSSSPWVAPR
jgi:AAA domain